MIVYLNGNLVDESEAVLPVFDRGVLFGDGVYETLRTYSGRIFALEDHLERLRVGCAYLQLRQRTSADYWLPILRELIDKNGLSASDCRIRLTITRGVGPVLSHFPQQSCTEIAHIFPIDATQVESEQRQGLTAVIARHRRAPEDVLFHVKTISLAHTISGILQARGSSATEAIFCNTRNEVCEAGNRNVFLLKGGCLITPVIESPCLPGITRKHLIHLAHESGFEVQERVVFVEELFQADAVLATSSISEIVPITRIDLRPLPDLPDAVERLQTLWRGYVDRTLESS